MTNYLTIDKVHATITKLITHMGQETAAYIYITGIAPETIFTAIQQEIVQTYVKNQTTTANTETEILVKAAAAKIVETMKAATSEKQGQLEIMREIFVGIQKETHASLNN